MNAPAAAEERRRRSSEDTWPALLVLALGLAVVALRAPLPIDETRYLEVFRESLHGSPLLLRLLGEPYAEKPPLLFWLGRLLALVLPAGAALRCVPALASAYTVLLVGRIGRRAGVEHAAWMQAALWLPSLTSQFLFFDPLLSVTIWGALEAWIRRRDTLVGLWSSAALLAKGPVAFLFLIPLFWSTTPLRPAGGNARRRATLVLLLALVPLAAWALSAAALGGPEFANALLWERWAGRVVNSPDHPRPLWFYVPVALVGALPATLVLFLRRGGGAPEWRTRLVKVLVLLLVVFTVISGKQAHYLVPAAPALALVLCESFAAQPAARARLRLGLRLQLGLLVCLPLVLVFVLRHRAHEFGPRGVACVESGLFLVPLAAILVFALAGLLLSWRTESLAKRLRIGALSAGLALLPVHWLAGQLLYPHELAAVLAQPPDELAYWGSSHHGVYALLASKTAMEKLPDEASIATWARAHPDGLVLIDPGDLKQPLPAGLTVVEHDVLHRSQVQVLRWTGS